MMKKCTCMVSKHPCPVSSRNLIKTFDKSTGDRLLAARENKRKHNLLDPKFLTMWK